MNILIIGFGSIGKRHYRNLLTLGYKKISVYDPSDLSFVDFPKVVRINSFSVREVNKFQVAFVCSPNNQHINNALICARSGCHIFIEKPLSYSVSGLDNLTKLCAKKRLITMVACNMRFNKCLQFIKSYLDKNSLGKIYSIQHEFGYYLPDWRPSQDYRKNYAAKKSTGGGIILDDIHEFDLMFWLNKFIGVKEVKFIYNKVSDLEIETEDNCMAVFKFKNKVLGLVKCDYLQRRYSRNCKVVGEKGNLEWDFSEDIVWLKLKDKVRPLFRGKNFNVNQMYLEELKYFFYCLKKNKNTFNDISQASNILNNILIGKKQAYE